MTAIDLSNVKVARRFTRSIRVDSDISDSAALDGYVLTQSAVDALLIMARHRVANRHGAFTWTGPYGSGKSSLALALAALLHCGKAEVKKIFKTGEPRDVGDLLDAFRKGAGVWTVVPVVGQRSNPEDVIATAVAAAVGTDVTRKPKERFAAWIGRVAQEQSGQGLVLIIDEMGKFLEHATLDGGDIHVFQELAEISSRSDGRLVVVGILHQAFDEYAHRLSRQARDEWLKVQGRFVDLSISLAGDEQIELIARAIEAPGHALSVDATVLTVASAVRGGRVDKTEVLASRLASCWPLHPLTAAMLGPLSRRRFGQSQRSIFGFLTSAEPFGFQDHLKSPSSGGLFEPSGLWDYLRANLEPAILASPDGHRWSTAVDAVERCEVRGGDARHLSVLKTIALLDLFKDRSGLQPTPDVVQHATADLGDAMFNKVIADLIAWSVIVFRKHSDSYAIYAGSDFDIEKAIEEARANGISVNFKQLAAQAALQPVLAKRHYETTGALRWFEVDIAPLHDAGERVRTYKPAAGSAGLFLVLVSANGEGKEAAKRIVKSAAAEAGQHLVIIGWTRDSYRLRELGAELACLEYVRAHRPELEGDAIARREVDARISRISADLDDRLSNALELVDWQGPADADLDKVTGLAGPAALSVLASRLADWRYPSTPHLRNELVNRTKPSSNAAAATRSLLRAMVEQRGVERLGLKGFPPEAGLFVSLLESTGLYAPSVQGGFAFVAPDDVDESGLAPLWRAADEALEADSEGCTLAEIFALWRQAPFGVRDGLLGILGVAYLLTRAERIATYLDEVFRPQLDGFLVDRLLQDASAVRMRSVELSDLDTKLIAGLAERLSGHEPIDPTPLEVARAVVQQVRALPNWTLRTSLLSDSATTLRNLGKNSSDPNQLLFEDLPRQMSRSGDPLAVMVHESILELKSAYAEMLTDLASTMFAELRFSPPLNGSYANLHKRADNVRGLSGNFRLDALATRLSSFDGDLAEVEGIASLAANKPPRDWVDRDIDAAKVEIAALAQQFLRAEGLAHLKGRADGRITMTVYLSDPSYPAPAAPHFELDTQEREAARDLAAKIEALIGLEGASSHIALGALAHLGLALADAADIDETRTMVTPE
ncbi:putative ATP-binding protein [Sphingomonas sp. SKA58]|uniref:ATP-binding protein n=1 Tax=Sphingomonas sp. (strain SKA58) TaxID=314266 RepID=UPI0000D7B461|nr:ATP-binding protein [Sphingomonas sp. SKA58]EAT08814.1 putative ATP-binding protein [Sphingomonas sp. SKA58]